MKDGRHVDVDISELKVDTQYQRPYRPWPANEKWNWDRYEPIIVSKRNEQLYVVKGQRRVELAKREGIQKLPAVIKSLTRQQEAGVFISESRVYIRPLEVFSAALDAEDKDALLIYNVATECGFEIRQGGKPNVIEAIRMLYTIFNSRESKYYESSESLLRETLRFASSWLEHWPADLHVHTGEMLRAISLWLAEHDHVRDHYVAEGRLLRVDPELVYRRANDDKKRFTGGGGKVMPLLSSIRKSAKTKETQATPAEFKKRKQL